MTSIVGVAIPVKLSEFGSGIKSVAVSSRNLGEISSWILLPRLSGGEMAALLSGESEERASHRPTLITTSANLQLILSFRESIFRDSRLTGGAEVRVEVFGSGPAKSFNFLEVSGYSGLMMVLIARRSRIAA